MGKLLGREPKIEGPAMGLRVGAWGWDLGSALGLGPWVRSGCGSQGQVQGGGFRVESRVAVLGSKVRCRGSRFGAWT